MQLEYFLLMLPLPVVVLGRDFGVVAANEPGRKAVGSLSTIRGFHAAVSRVASQHGLVDYSPVELFRNVVVMDEWRSVLAVPCREGVAVVLVSSNERAGSTEGVHGAVAAPASLVSAEEREHLRSVFSGSRLF